MCWYHKFSYYCYVLKILDNGDPEFNFILPRLLLLEKLLEVLLVEK